MNNRRSVISLPVVVGLGLLILAAYLDNSRGPLLPHIARSMGFDYSGSSIFLVVGHLAAVFAMATLFPILNRYNERSVSWFCLFLAALTVVMARYIQSYTSLLVFAGTIGICTSLLGTMSNVVVMAHSPSHRLGRNLALLHVMYGVGSTLGTIVTGQILGFKQPWSYALLTLIPFIALLAFTTRRLPDASIVTGNERRQPVNLHLQHWLVIFIFTAYVAGEVLTSMWMTTYLVETDGLSIADASWYGTAFFISMSISRSLMIFDRFHKNPDKILFGCLAVGSVFSVLGVTGWRFFLPLVGVVGPFFTLLLARASHLYHTRHRSITLYVFVAMQFVLGTMHLLIGQFSKAIPIRESYWLAPIALLISLILLGIHFRATASIAKS